MRHRALVAALLAMFVVPISGAFAAEKTVASGKSVGVFAFKGLGVEDGDLGYLRALVEERILHRGVRLAERERAEEIATLRKQFGIASGILLSQYQVGGTVIGSAKPKITGNCRSVETGDYIATFSIQVASWS